MKYNRRIAFASLFHIVFCPTFHLRIGNRFLDCRVFKKPSRSEERERQEDIEEEARLGRV